MPAERILYEHASTPALALAERFKRGRLAELQPYPSWVVWRKEGEQKVPYSPTPSHVFSRASSARPETWGTLNDALAALSEDKYNGVGFMLDPKRIPLIFIDLDHCVEPGTGRITDPKVEALVKRVNSYTEVSQSGTGLHILAYGTLPGSGIHADIEMYAKGRYFTVTAQPIPVAPLTIERREAEIEVLYAAHKPKVSFEEYNTVVVERSGPPLLDLPPQAARDPLLQELLRGEIARFAGDESRADFVLLMKLLHWTGDDIALTKRLYLASPLGQRKKALEKRGPTTYLDMTLGNVLKKRRNLPMRR